MMQRLSRLIALALCGSMLAPVLPAQQQDPASRGKYTIKVSSDLVLVNVTVRDKQGNPVRGLTANDFQVLEDGKPQKISAFDAENIETAAIAQGPQQQETAGGVPAKVLATRDTNDISIKGHRLIVMFFDFSGMETDEIDRAVSAAQKYVDQQMTPADLVAIASFSSSFQVNQDFTTDRALLKQALGRFTGSSGSEGMTASATDADTAGSDNAFTPDDTDFNTFNTDRRLAALQALSEMLARIEQKKSVIYFSGGVTRNGVENQSQLRATVNAAVKANVAIYTLDSRGLEALPPGGDASKASVRGVSAYSGGMVSGQFDSNFSSQETLSTLATDTGGKAFLDSNDFSGVFSKVQQDTSTYYVISYRSANQVKDGRFRKITVKTARKDLKLEFRPGYFAPRDFAHFNKDDREQQMEQELASELPDTDVGVYLSAAYFRLDNDRFFVPVSLVVPASEIPFAKVSDLSKATLDIIGQVRDAESKIPVSNVRETVKLAVDDKQDVLRKNVQYNTGFILAPGKYDVKFVIRENQTGKLGSFETALTIPDLRQKQKSTMLKMSSVVFSGQIKPAAKTTKENPLVREGKELVPNVTHVFSADQHLYLYFEVYDPAKDKNNVRVLSSVQFFNGKVKAFETPLVHVENLASNRKAAVFQLDVPLDKLKPGYYTCQVNVIDDAAGTFYFPRFDLLVKEPKPAVAATAAR